MKKLKNIVLVALVGLAFSCNDAIDINQPGRLTADVAFRNVTDLQSGLIGLYRQLDVTPQQAFASVFTDEVAIGFDSGGQGVATYDFVMNPGSAAPANFWVRNFRVNNRATILINAAALITPANATEQATYNNIVGQAHAIRAFANFELLSHISPNLTDNSSLGIPVIDFIPALTIQPTRNTTGESFDYINSDLAIAEANLTSQSNPTFVSRDFVTAMKARIAAARGDQPTAGTLAQQLLGSYPIANRTQYQLMFLDADNTEIIFKLDRTRGDAYDGQGQTDPDTDIGGGWAGAVYAFVNATLAGSPYMEMDRSLFNLMNPADIRYTVNVAPTSVINPNYATDPDPVNTDILVIQKYPGSEGRPLMNDLKVFRSAEMLLILAESRAFAGNFNGANSTATLIKQLRDARFGSAQPLPVYASQADALAAVLDERRIELAFEGHRFRDLKRVGPAANRGVQRDLTDCTAQSGACSLAATDFRFALPIPIVEINANPGIRAQQNPGYN